MIKYVIWMYVGFGYPQQYEWVAQKAFTFPTYEECTATGERSIAGYPKEAYRCLPSDFDGPMPQQMGSGE